MSSVLVTGGAGYIGSHTAKALTQEGIKLFILDNLYSGHRWAAPKNAEFIEGDISNSELLDKVFSAHDIRSVIHFAGHIEVEESTRDPLKYYKNNVGGSFRLIDACAQHKIKEFIFSSTASVYGVPKEVPVDEAAPLQPFNPYGRTKLIVEQIIRDLAAATPDFRFVMLRYFNVAGASLDNSLGQATPNATHLIKIASQVACGKRDSLSIFGSDYSTPDGTCIRDYIHVSDLADAHVLALRYLRDGGKSETLNCGYGHGFSVKDVIATMEKVAAKKINVKESPRRAGDVPMLIAKADRIRKILNWTPKCDDLSVICKTALDWEREGLKHYSR